MGTGGGLSITGGRTVRYGGSLAFEAEWLRVLGTVGL